MNMFMTFQSDFDILLALVTFLFPFTCIEIETF